ncbi:biotin/lipoyl-binding protein [Ktedonosporobacter rubrisoli]|uniref:Biotin carboxyl carrier protein of acetyl-CoA carboxylase n=1 Tax=Ktedonosporobacter rubrisoli TaxID=2509675 RepID=A0A4P6JYI9_KTERU|nr:biotin/lipoyl-containing protein [Ktedonosporobacter rubrisoli]QBD80543.1 biotin/lipoyl-binding protein [Ktedonosporobacter rubrisoli]
MEKQKKLAWLERVEDLVHALEDSTVGELELIEGDMEIVIRRQPGILSSAVPVQGGSAGPLIQVGASGRAPRVDQSVAIVAPLTGVYYGAPSPTLPPFVTIGDSVQVGQVVAIVEAMKVFNEITADISGRVVALVAPSGEVVQKGDVILRIEPA